jgi:O-antigen ligase
MIAAHPFAGVGPARVATQYRNYVDVTQSPQVNPHLHNVPVQIAAERGLPALATWIWMIATLAFDMIRRLKFPETRFLAAAALGCIVAMIAAGMAEYNFGDSEFLMLFLVMMTLPYAAKPAGV